jgi:Tfp pilus assembly protein PilO
VKTAPTVHPAWRRRFLPPVLALLGLNVAVFAVYTLPRTLQARRATSRAAQARAEVEAAKKEVGELRGRADALKANAEDSERFYGGVDGRAELLRVLEDVEKMAREPGLKTGSRNFTTGDISDPRLARIKVTLPLEGSYDQLVGFLQRVERSKHFLTVDRIALSGQEGEGSAKLQVELSAYFRGDGRTGAEP